MIALYLTFFILIILDYKEELYPLAKWIFPFCNLRRLLRYEFSDLVFLFDIFIHSIFITSYLCSIGIVKIILL
jgi:hypothetical protein